MLRLQGAQVGRDEAQRWIALSDGGAGLDYFLDVNFPRAQRILDFWHAAQEIAEGLQSIARRGEQTAYAAMFMGGLAVPGPDDLIWSAVFGKYGVKLAFSKTQDQGLV